MAKRKGTEPLAESAPAEYTVVARRYRPQQFSDLVGQEPVAQSLIHALQSQRVAHAYLFTGLRGVGKTSAARILAKALNCVKGPTPTPCDECESCLAIAAGQDVDVLEIDGASNNKVEEVRDLRQNVQFRPSRSRYKIYIIDEVHMLSTAAFNALLKTLEEPPPHVKFILATTEASKIPVTILSRCQRFDFAGIPIRLIVERLRTIVAEEKKEADEEALELIARRAGGSMRDAQSLLDQLLAFSDQRLNAEQVHQLLGTAPDDAIAAIATAVLAHDASKALAILDAALTRGLQPGELLDQIIAYWRDLMLIGSGGPEVAGIAAPQRLHPTLKQQSEAVSLDTILAGLDVLQATKARFRGSGHGRVLMEMALVRLSRMDSLVALAQIARMLQGDDSGRAPRPSLAQATTGSNTLSAESAKKKSPDLTEGPSTNSLTESSLVEVWAEVLSLCGPILGRQLERAGLPAILGPNRLALTFSSAYNQEREYCSGPDRTQRLVDVIRRVTGENWDVRLESGQNGQETPVSKLAPQPAIPAGQHPLVKSVIDLLGAKLLRVDDGFGQIESGASDDEQPPVVETEES